MFSNRFQELADSVQHCQYSTQAGVLNEDSALKEAFKMIALTQFRGGIVYVIGNGGSAGIASHFSADLIKSLQVPSQTLYDSNLVTCLSNDWGYENVFSYPLEKLLKPQDLVVAISSSGKSPNIVKAAEVTLKRQASLITLSGFSGENPLRQLGHLNFWVGKNDYGLVEASHFFLLHTIIDLWHKHAKDVRDGSAKDQVAARHC